MPEGFRLLDDEIQWPAATRRELWDIVQVQFGRKTEWQLRLELADNGQAARATFDDVVSFRVHDEAEIVEYWTARDREGIGVGTCYAIRSSDYLDEISRGITGISRNRPMRHFLLCGRDICVEVIGSE